MAFRQITSTTRRSCHTQSTKPNHIPVSPTLPPLPTSLPSSYTVTPPIIPWPRHLTPPRLVSLINRQQDTTLAFQIFHYASTYSHPPFSHTSLTYDAIIHTLCRAREFSHVESLLSQLALSQIKCHERVFVSVIRHYGLSGKPFHSFRTFTRLHQFNVKPSVKSLNTVLNALVQNKTFDLVYTTFRDSNTRYGISPDVTSCNILVKAMCKNGDIESAVKVFDEMPEMGLVPNVVTYTTLLGGYASRGDMVGAKRVFGELKDRGWVPDATTYTVLMDGYCKVGRLLDAVKVMDEMEENGVEANEVTYGVMIQAFCKGKKSGEACKMLDDMLERRYVPSSGLCSKVIDALCRDGKVEDACGLWRRMVKKNCCVRDSLIVGTLVHWLCKEGKVWEARRMFGEFEKGEVPSVFVYNTLIAGMCGIGELGEAGRIWDDMVEKGVRPNAFTYDALVKGFCKIGNAREGFGVLKEMVNKGFLLNKLTLRILIEGLSESQMRGEIDKVVSMAIERGAVDSDLLDLSLKKVICHVDEGLNALDGLVLEHVTK